MRLDEFDFPFDPRLIADHPVEPRDRARMLVVPRGGGPRTHRHVTDLPDLLDPGDLVVVNDTKVVPAALAGRKRPHGGRVTLLVLRPAGDGAWEAMVKGRVRPGQVIEVGPGDCLTVAGAASPGGLITVAGSRPIPDLVRAYGQIPLPPYIKRPPTPADRDWYQTIFAREEGAVAAPTAGLHFSQGVLDGLRARGVTTARVTLHVGPATFRPVTAERVEDHEMGTEQLIVSEEAATAVNHARAEGRRVLAVGTTVVRALESAADEAGTVRPCRSETGLFITPGYRFRCVGGLLTNFHLPRTTLLMLVSAFVGVEALRAAYREAIEARYRFYSYGDAMLIL
jgi:S-adenosylmethionine:tRNA ribosyltransferase-isomerase